MSVSRWGLLFAALLLAGLSGNGYAAARAHAPVNKHAQLLQGVWVGAEGMVVFNANNTMSYKGAEVLLRHCQRHDTAQQKTQHEHHSLSHCR